MCMICDGFSAEEALAAHDALIAEHGFTMIGVTPHRSEDGGALWTYTLGLLDAVGHPELVVAGPDLGSSAELLGTIARDVLAGGEYGPGDVIGDAPHAITFGAVDPVQQELGTFTTWFEMKAAGYLSAPRFDAVQVFAPDAWFCACHQGRQPDLSDPKVRIEAVGHAGTANRATRRARARDRRRAHPH